MPEIQYHVPATAKDMLPPKPSSLVTEAANFLRAHWDEVRPYYAAISGEEPSIHGATDLDQAACVFEVQRIAKKNGFAMLGKVKAAKLRSALRFGYKRNTGVSLRLLEKQGRHLRLEYHEPEVEPQSEPEGEQQPADATV